MFFGYAEHGKFFATIADNTDPKSVLPRAPRVPRG